jgi:DNA-binding SARP family transcriptional activator/tetratricopeptide (TPR) repeat protein
MRLTVLGPIGLGSQTPSARKMLTVLAMLLVHPNRVVSARSLIDELWGEAPPATAMATLHVYVSRLRHIFAAAEPAGVAGVTGVTGAEGAEGAAGPGDTDRQDAQKARIVTRPSGYLLRVMPGELDLDRFDSLHTQGRDAFRRKDFAAASRLLREALDLWSGPVLAGVRRGARLDAMAAGLDERRALAREQRIAADMQLGRHRELLGELTALTHEQPLDEVLHAHLIVALYRSDRQADALAGYARIRRALHTELGMEPGPALGRLHQRVLRFDPELNPPQPSPAAGSAAGAGGTPPAPTASSARYGPAEVPAAAPLRPPQAVPGFVGRDDSLAAACGALAGGHTRTVAVTGPSGIGKTAFATELARRAAPFFPGGCAVVALRDADGRPLDPREALVRLLHQLAPGAVSGPAGVDELAEALRRSTEGRRLLLVLDDVAGEAQVRPILHALPDSGVVLTGRGPLTALAGVHCVPLGELSPDHAAALLATTGGDRITDDPESAALIARLCGHLPLALRVAGAALAACPHWSAASLAARLGDDRARLGLLTVGDLDVRAVLLTGYREMAPAEQRAFRLLGLAAPGFSRRTAEALLDDAGPDTERLLDALVRVNILQARRTAGRPVRYGFHALYRAMALELLEEEDPKAVKAAVARLCVAHLTAARYADALVAPGRADRPGPAPAGADLKALIGESPMRWFEEEVSGLVAGVRQAHRAGLWRLAWQLADSAAGYLQATASWELWDTANASALDAARRLGDPAAQAVLLCSRGDMAWQRHDTDEAADCFRGALRQARVAADRRSEARALIGLADVMLERGRARSARLSYARALVLCRAEDDSRGLTDALRGIALSELRDGRPSAALRLLAECGRVARRLGDPNWSEYATRTAERIRNDADAGDVETRPGVWLIGDSAA